MGEGLWAGTLARSLGVWQLRNETRKKLVDFVRNRLAVQRAALGSSQEEIDEAGYVFDENWLTLGFARRFAAYKRPTMLLRDQERLVRILTNGDRKVQLVLAGKAHPQDTLGQAMIKQWHEFIRRPELRRHAVFLADYDMMMTQELVAGVDVWLNMPRRPWEACGTSGMKVLANGGLNVSELDGWWAEAYAPDVGWAIGDGRDRGENPDWDAAEADALYSLLEGEVVRGFYTRDEGVPREWVARIRESMARLTPEFSANRAVRQYVKEHYLPLASAYCGRAPNNGSAAVDLLAWERRMAARWHEVRFGAVEVSNYDGQYSYRVEVGLGSIQPTDVQVEIYADSLEGGPPFRRPMAPAAAAEGSPPGTYSYTAAVPADRPANYYTPRVIPQRNGVFVPLECALIAWQK